MLPLSLDLKRMGHDITTVTGRLETSGRRGPRRRYLGCVEGRTRCWLGSWALDQLPCTLLGRSGTGTWTR